MRLKVFVSRSVVERNAAEGTTHTPFIIATEQSRFAVNAPLKLGDAVTLQYDPTAPDGQRVWLDVEGTVEIL